MKVYEHYENEWGNCDYARNEKSVFEIFRRRCTQPDGTPRPKDSLTVIGLPSGIIIQWGDHECFLSRSGD